MRKRAMKFWRGNYERPRRIAKSSSLKQDKYYASDSSLCCKTRPLIVSSRFIQVDLNEDHRNRRYERN